MGLLLLWASLLVNFARRNFARARKLRAATIPEEPRGLALARPETIRRAGRGRAVVTSSRSLELEQLVKNARIGHRRGSSVKDGSYDVSVHFEPSVATTRLLAIVVCLASCSGNPSATRPETSERASTATDKESASVGGSSVPAEPAGSSLKGAAIEAWFRQRGAETPGTLNLEDSQCETVRAPVPSGQALSCEQHAAIKPWVRISRRILFDARDGRTMVLMNLTSKVEPFGPPSGAAGACEGALVVLRVQLSGDGKALTVGDDTGCGCEQAEKRLDKGNSDDAKALELQAREVKQACSQRGAYVWEAHGYAPAHGS